MSRLRTSSAVIGVALVLAGCGQAPARSATLASAAASDAPIFGDFDLGEGRKLYLGCAGTGSPTIVLDVGSDDTMEGSWSPVYLEMTSISRACYYDRANLGRSDADPGPRTIQDVADDLVTLLHLADVPGPYVFVGGSFGGNVVGVLAAHHPEEVAGIVFVDSQPANDDPALNPLLLNLGEAKYNACCSPDHWMLPYDAPENIEHIDFEGGLEVEFASVHAQPEVPTIVLTASRLECEPDWPCDAIAADEARLQREWIAGNPDGEQRIIESGHVMQREAPQAIIDATRDVVELVRAAS